MDGDHRNPVESAGMEANVAELLRGWKDMSRDSHGIENNLSRIPVEV